jgi:hypothetical protein
MPTRSQQPQPKVQDRVKHPLPVERALNPGVEAVRTRGTPRAQEPRTRPASELKEVVRALSGFTSDELRQIRVVVPGSRLAPGATYLDLRRFDRAPFAAADESYAGKDAWYVAKIDTPPPLWKRLQGPSALRAGPEGRTRHISQGGPELRGGRERSERRGSSATRSVQSPARHHRARSH